MKTFVALLLATVVVVAGCGGGASQAPSAGRDTHFYYDTSGRLAAVQRGGTTAVYRFDDAGNRVAVDRVRSRDFDPHSLRAHAPQGPRVTGLSPKRVAQGATVVVRGSGFDTDVMGDVVEVGGALGRVLNASSHELRVQLPPVAAPGPVTVSTAYGKGASKDDLVVVPAEVDPSEVDQVVATDIGKGTTLGSGSTLVTFRGKAGSTVELKVSASEGCDTVEVGLAGPTGTIIEADADDASWCDRAAQLPMTGSYVAMVTSSGSVRATLTSVAGGPASRLLRKPVAKVAPQASVAPETDGPPGFPVDLSSGLMDTAVTDLALGGSGAVDLTRTFSVGDLDLPAVAPEEPFARHWSVAGSIALEPSMSYSYLDLVMPDGRRLPFQRVTEGAPEPTGAVFEPSAGVGSGPFAGSQVAYTGSGWELKTRAGTILGFGRTGSPLRLNWVRDRSGHTSRFVRAPGDDGSPDGGLVGVISDSGQWARFDRDSEGRITAATDQVGDRVTYGYGRPARLFADVLTRVRYQRPGAAPATVGYRYQPLTGRLVAVTDGRRDRIQFGYDDAGRVVHQRVLGPGAVPVEWHYAYTVGQRRASIPGRHGSIALPHIERAVVNGPGGRRTVSFRGVRRVTPAAGPTSVPQQRAPGVFVDARGRVAARRTPDGGVTRIGYDAFDRPTSITDPGGASTRFTYTRSGDLASVTDEAGTTRYSWNQVGQETAETDPLGGQQHWRYNRAGRLVWSRDARGVVSTFGYDRDGRVDVAQYGEARVRYGYDRAGRLTSVRDSEDGSATLRYDAKGRLVGEVSRSGSVSATYDKAGRRSSLVLPGGVRASYGYDDAGRPDQLSLSDGSSETRVAASYDTKGRLKGLDLPDGVRGQFAYADGQLSGLNYTRGGEAVARQTVGHDSAGRVDRLAGDLGRTVLPAAQPDAKFDVAHELIDHRRSAWRHDRAGNLLQDDTHRYTWDGRGRLVGVSGPGTRTTYEYDALGRRTSAVTVGKTVRYVYAGDDVVQQVADDGTRTSYLRGPEGTPLVSMTNRGGGTALLPDLFGNVGAAVKADGTAQRFSYDTFGVPEDRTATDLPGFRGLVADQTGQLSMGARTYDPSTGRFLSRDSWGIEGGDTDLYRYALGAPTVFTDPSGHAAECVGMALGWAMSVLGPGGGWDDYDALEDKVDSGQISQDEWTVQADRVSHDLWSGFDVVANVCGTTAVGSSAAALPLLGAGKVGSRVLGSLADDAVTGAAATRVGTGFGEIAPSVSLKARMVLDRLLQNRGLVPSRTVRFTQDSARETFTDGRSVLDLANKMATTGRAPPDLTPIRVFEQEGELFSLDNRRLFAGQYANVDLPYRWASPAEVMARRQTQIDRGRSISIRMPGGKENWGWWQP